MHSIANKYKVIPDVEAYHWYVLFVGVIKNINLIEHTLKNRKVEGYRLWAPTFQEHRRIKSNLVLVDRLLYSGYVFIGFQDKGAYDSADMGLSGDGTGYLLGGADDELNKEDLENIKQQSLKFLDIPRVFVDVKLGSSVLINSGIFAGLHGIIKKIHSDGRLLIKVFFMNRDMEVDISILEIQNLGGALKFYDDD